MSRSKGYQEPYVAAQETRVRYFHETLHDYLNGKLPNKKAPITERLIIHFFKFINYFFGNQICPKIIAPVTTKKSPNGIGVVVNSVPQLITLRHFLLHLKGLDVATLMFCAIV